MRRWSSSGARSPEARTALADARSSPTPAEPGGARSSPALPELAGVPWRPRVTERSLVRRGRLWTLTTLAHSVPFGTAAVALTVVKPITIPVGLILIAHAWIIPELYAARGANVVRPRPLAPGRPAAQARSLLLLGDLIDHAARQVHAETGLVPERGALGMWLLGEAGALLIRPGGRRVGCYCVTVREPDLPSGDRIAHLLLALRSDEAGFATVANLAFSGARWRLRRRLAPPAARALDSAAAIAAARPGADNDR